MAGIESKPGSGGNGTLGTLDAIMRKLGSGGSVSVGFGRASWTQWAGSAESLGFDAMRGTAGFRRVGEEGSGGSVPAARWEASEPQHSQMFSN